MPPQRSSLAERVSRVDIAQRRAGCIRTTAVGRMMGLRRLFSPSL